MLHGRLWGRGLWSGWRWVDEHRAELTAGLFGVERRKEVARPFAHLSGRLCKRTNATSVWQPIEGSIVRLVTCRVTES